jgi:ribosome recycling factor
MAYNFSDFKTALKKVEEWLSKEYSGVHTGRATPTLLDTISVESYGSYQPIKNVGTVSIEDPKTLRIVPWDKSVIKEIERAIVAANLGLSVAPDQDGVRIIFPMLTTENRQKLVKVLKEKLEDARISVRKEREEASTKMKAADLPEDDMFRAKEEMQKYVDESNKNLEAIFEKKEHEVMN